jgi:hypothetical protein
MKWMIPINQLDAVQTRVIEEILENLGSDHLVKGFAGSGKTIVLTHVLERLAAGSKRRNICFATHTHALKDMVESGLSAQALDKITITTFDALRNTKRPYDILVADEVQDIRRRYLDPISESYLSLIAAADFDQRIYLDAANEDEITKLLRFASEHELQEIHRINDNVFQVATSILEARVPDEALIRDDADKTLIYRGATKLDEMKTVYQEAKRVAAREQPSAVLFPTKKLIKEFIDLNAGFFGWQSPPNLESKSYQGDRYSVMNAYLAREKTGLQVFGSGSGEMADSDRRPVTYLMTYHSAKGLDFPQVFLPHLTSGTRMDPMVQAKDEDERRLFFVAITRAKRRLFLSYHGTPHRFIGEIDSKLLTPFKIPKRTY